VELLYLVVAAAFGYVATIVHKRYEVNRATALDIDTNLQEALDIALQDAVMTDKDLADQLVALLRRAEHRTVALPPRTQSRIHDQVHLVTYLAYNALDPSRFTESNDEDEPIGAEIMGDWFVQMAIHAARETVAPLVRPALIPRGPGKPTSFYTPESFAKIIKADGRKHALRKAAGDFVVNTSPGHSGPLADVE
jgi:hypothetical protein